MKNFFAIFQPACWAALLLVGLAASHAADAPHKPNFIVVLCDNLGYGDIEPFGSTLHRTPHLNRMAKEGRKFTHFCVTAGVCTPSRASLMTGCYAQRVGMHFNERDGWVLRPVSRYGLHPDEVTIAEVLKEQGYATAIVGKWHLGDQPEFLPTRQGFDWFFGVPYSDDMTAREWKKDGSKWPPLPLMENEKVIEAPCDRNGLTKRYTKRAMEWIAEHKHEPFFLYFPQAMPGSTSKPFSSPEFKGKSRNGPWGDAIEELDWSMGAMLDQIRELGIAENTFVIWTSDNGAPVNHDPSDLRRGSNRPLHGRGYTTSEGAFRVPTIVWQPGKVPAGTVCDELATTMDLLPTFSKLAGAKAQKNGQVDGHDISSLLFEAEPPETPYQAFYYYHQDQLQAVRSGPWKVFLPVTPSGAHPHFNAKQKPETLLFHLVDDVACRKNIASEHPDVVARLTEFAEAAREDLGDKGRRGSGQRERGKVEREPQPQLLKKLDDDLPLIGFTQLRTNLPGGRHANVRTGRAIVMLADGSERREVGAELITGPDQWTQFGNWSPDGSHAVIGSGWQDPENAQWEEKHQRFRMEPGKWRYDGWIWRAETGALTDVCSVDRVSHYNGVSFASDGKKLLMTSLTGGTSKPFLMDLDGSKKTDVSGGTGGFTYGFNASPDGKRICYHENYQVYLANADGSDKTLVETGNPFNFAPTWSPDGQWLLFVSGEHYNCHPHVVRADGTGLRKLADRNGYRGVTLFLDVPDFHQGSSDTAVWATDSKSVFYCAKVGEAIELFRVGLDGTKERLTKSEAGTTHYHARPSPDGRSLLYGSKRNGVRQLFVRDLTTGHERQLTKLSRGHAAMWARWQPRPKQSKRRSRSR